MFGTGEGIKYIEMKNPRHWSGVGGFVCHIWLYTNHASLDSLQIYDIIYIEVKS